MFECLALVRSMQFLLSNYLQSWIIFSTAYTSLRLWSHSKKSHKFDWIVRPRIMYHRIHILRWYTWYIHNIDAIDYNSQLNCFTWDICSFELVANITYRVQCGTCLKLRLTISNLLTMVIKNLKCFKYINDHWSVENEFRQSIWFVNDTKRWKE